MDLYLPELTWTYSYGIMCHGLQGLIIINNILKYCPFVTRPHPHNLVGREKCDEGVCTVKTTITEENPQVSFSNLGIQCVKRKDIANALRTRERLRVDPFKSELLLISS